VAYGIKDCGSLAMDPSFNYPELSGKAQYAAPVSSCSGSQECGASFTSNITGDDKEQLLKLISELVDAMKGGQ